MNWTRSPRETKPGRPQLGEPRGRLGVGTRGGHHGRSGRDSPIALSLMIRGCVDDCRATATRRLAALQSDPASCAARHAGRVRLQAGKGETHAGGELAGAPRVGSVGHIRRIAGSARYRLDHWRPIQGDGRGWAVLHVGCSRSAPIGRGPITGRGGRGMGDKQALLSNAFGCHGRQHGGSDALRT